MIAVEAPGNVFPTPDVTSVIAVMVEACAGAITKDQRRGPPGALVIITLMKVAAAADAVNTAFAVKGTIPYDHIVVLFLHDLREAIGDRNQLLIGKGKRGCG